MSDDFIEVKCPDCDNVLIVNRRTGKTVEVRRKILEESTGDRFEDAMEKVRQSKSALEKKVEAARAKERDKMERLNALFKEGMDKARAEGPITKPERELDLD